MPYKDIFTLPTSEYSATTHSPNCWNITCGDISRMPPADQCNERMTYLLGLSHIPENAQKMREKLIEWFEENKSEPWIGFINQALHMSSFGELYVKDISWERIWIGSIQVKDWRNVSLQRYLDEEHIDRIAQVILALGWNILKYERGYVIWWPIIASFLSEIMWINFWNPNSFRKHRTANPNPKYRWSIQNTSEWLKMSRGVVPEK